MAQLPMHIEIITIGDELVEGRLTDTHSAYLSDLLVGEGFTVQRHTSVADDLEAIVGIFREAAARSAAVLVAGGLGPTTDDLTAEAAAQAFARPLQVYEEALEHVRMLFRRMGRPMTLNNEKQALLPADSQLLPNTQGTATGFSLDHAHCRLYFMPGVPRELKVMFERVILPDLRNRLSPEPVRVATFKVFGLGESHVGSLLEGLRAPPPGRLLVQYRAASPEVHVRLCLRGYERWESAGDETLEALADQARTLLGRAVFGEDGASLPEVLLEGLRKREQTLALAESCTGGMLGAELTAIPGASEVLLGGIVSYANSAKQELLGVAEDLLVSEGAVSQPVVEAMASGARARFGSSYALAITGVAGPGGGTREKPVGTVWIALASAEGTESHKLLFPGDRERVRRYSAWSAMDLLRRRLTF